MRYYLRGRICLVFFSFSLFSLGKLKAQAFDFNTFFTANAIGFMNPDSNNMIYDELHNVDEMVAQLDSLFPFYEQEYYGAYPNIQVSDSISFLPGLHNPCHSPK